MLGQQRRLVALSVPAVCRAPLTVGGYSVLSGVLNGHFERDREIECNTGELDSQTGATRDVEVGQLTKGVLQFEDAHEFSVQREDAGTTRLRCRRDQIRAKQERCRGNLLRTRPRMFSSTESTELMPSSLSFRDGLRSLMASRDGVRDVRGDSQEV